MATAIALFHNSPRLFINLIFGFISICGAFGGSPMASVMVKSSDGAVRSFSIVSLLSLSSTFFP